MPLKLETEEQHIARLKELVAVLPESPGVYQYLDKNGTIIYVGKAVPLKLTPWWTSRPYPDNKQNRELVWPEENNMEIIFQELVDAKLERNAEISAGNPSVSQSLPRRERRR